MDERLPAHYLDLLQQALLKSFNRKKALRQFLRRSGVSERTLAQWHTEDETKREWLERLIPAMEDRDEGRKILLQMGRQLAQQKSFPDLNGWEESARMIEEARAAVADLAAYFEQQESKAFDEKQRKAIREAAERQRAVARERRGSLESLSSRLAVLAETKLGTQEGGYAFEEWFYDLMAFSEIEHRSPYRIGRQIDGSITLVGTTYLVETKFGTKPSAPIDVSDFYRKVVRKADNTMGLFVSMSGFTPQAVNEARGERSPILLLTSAHMFQVLQNVMTFSELVQRLRRHASQTGEPLLPQDF